MKADRVNSNGKDGRDEVTEANREARQTDRQAKRDTVRGETAKTHLRDEKSQTDFLLRVREVEYGPIVMKDRKGKRLTTRSECALRWGVLH